MVTALRIDGVDLSHHNAVGDPEKAVAAGVKFVYHKATEGASFVDVDYSARRRIWKMLKIPFGAYHFASPSKNDARQEAAFFVKHADPKPGDLFPCLDLEQRGGMNDEELTTWAETFFDEVRKLTKIKGSMLYSNYDLTRKVADFLWVARYSNSNAEPRVPRPWARWDLRQFSNGDFGVPNRVDGLGHVDLNTMRPGLKVPDFVIPEPEKEKPVTDPTPEPKPEPINNVFIHGSHNLLFTLNRRKWREDLDKSRLAHLVGYQETEGADQRAALAEWSKDTGRALYDPAKTGNAIGFDKDVFEYLMVEGEPYRGHIHPHPSAKAMGVPSKRNPGRDFVYVGLVHKATGKKLLKINVHPLAGGLKKESHPDNQDSPELSKYKDWGVTQYWLDVLAFTALEMSKQEPDSMKNFWDIILLGGDYNATFMHVERWYYPANLLAALFVPDTIEGGLDHLQRAHGSDVVSLRRWRIRDVHTDHPLHFEKLRIEEVEDRPRD